MKWMPQVGHVGEEPAIGALCESVLVLQQQVGALISDPAMVSYFKLGGMWYHLCFDGDIAFCKQCLPPAQPINRDLESATVLVDLSEMEGVVGSRLTTLAYANDEDSVSLELRFDGGGSVVLRHSHEQDATALEYRWTG